MVVETLCFGDAFQPMGLASWSKWMGPWEMKTTAQYWRKIWSSYLNLDQRWIFQQDNDPKHTSRMAKKWFQDHHINVLEWSSQSPDLNPIENKWNELKTRVREREPSNLKNLERWQRKNGAKYQWRLLETCNNLVTNYKHFLGALIKCKGHFIP